MKRLLFLILVVGGLVIVADKMGYSISIGGLVLAEEDFERMKKAGKVRSRIHLGGCVLAKGIAPELILEVMPSLTVIGGLVADKSVGQAYEGRLTTVGGAVFRDPDTESSDHVAGPSEFPAEPAF